MTATQRALVEARCEPCAGTGKTMLPVSLNPLRWKVPDGRWFGLGEDCPTCHGAGVARAEQEAKHE